MYNGNMKSLEEMIKELPPDLRQEVEDFIEFLLKKRKKRKKKPRFNWVGALGHLKEKYTSLDLQHEAIKWWLENELDRH